MRIIFYICNISFKLKRDLEYLHFIVYLFKLQQI